MDQRVRARDLEILFGRTTLSIKLKNSNSILLKGELHKAVKADECMWHLNDGTEIVLEIQKADTTDFEHKWSCLLKGDPEIDIHKLNIEDNLSDYDPEARYEITKMMQKDLDSGKKIFD
uniref:CS domain-containing protein n=1 Tax=Arcella intermedia TaxID=1963864 RepID=A0A6B2LPX8_9EUKA